jgi:hypothetical protein
MTVNKNVCKNDCICNNLEINYYNKKFIPNNFYILPNYFCEYCNNIGHNINNCKSYNNYIFSNNLCFYGQDEIKLKSILKNNITNNLKITNYCEFLDLNIKINSKPSINVKKDVTFNLTTAH